jgi:hypothetical protein
MKNVLLDEGFEVNIISKELKKILRLRRPQPKEVTTSWIDQKLENKRSRVFIQDFSHNINYGKKKRGILHVTWKPMA